jgi:hypothetical protein
LNREIVAMPLVSCLRILAAVALVITACGNATVGAKAEEPSADATQKRIAELVQQLGDVSYRLRDYAGEELLKYGMQTKAALLAGMERKDLEIAARCRRLWFEVRIEDGWRHVRELIGDSPQSRELFDTMFLAAPEAWYELAETTRGADVLFEERRGQ